MEVKRAQTQPQTTRLCRESVREPGEDVTALQLAEREPCELGRAYQDADYRLFPLGQLPHITVWKAVKTQVVYLEAGEVCEAIKPLILCGVVGPSSLARLWRIPCKSHPKNCNFVGMCLPLGLYIMLG